MVAELVSALASNPGTLTIALIGGLMSGSIVLGVAAKRAYSWLNSELPNLLGNKIDDRFAAFEANFKLELVRISSQQQVLAEKVESQAETDRETKRMIIDLGERVRALEIEFASAQRKKAE